MSGEAMKVDDAAIAKQNPPLEPGARIGRYVVHAELAAGGMGRVHLGRMIGPMGFSRPVAIKRLHPHYGGESEFVAMFVDEARLASRVRHPNVAQTLDVVVEEHEIAVVMEYVHGESIAWLRRHAEAFPIPIAIGIAIQMLYGLHAAHVATDPGGASLELVHRDVSPQNVVAGVDGVVRVLDFGVAKAAWRLHNTRDGALKGKVAYMAPEQLAWQSVDRRADVFAASVVLWEMLTGRRLFATGASSDPALRVSGTSVDPPSKHGSAVTPELDAIVMRGLAHTPQDRWDSALDMAAALERTGSAASQRELGDWVARTAAPSLDVRSALLREMENAEPVPESAGSAKQPGDARLTEAAAIEQRSREETRIQSSNDGDAPADAPSSERPRRARRAAAVLAVTAIAAAAAAVLLRPKSQVLLPEPERSAVVAPSEPTESAPSPQASVIPSAPVTSAVAPTEREPSIAPSTRKASGPSPKRPKTPVRSGAARPNCDPNYTVDADGTKHFKPECF